jgi:hypothetical protein
MRVKANAIVKETIPVKNNLFIISSSVRENMDVINLNANRL